MTTGSEFYDTAHIFETYRKNRSRNNTPNETLEAPIIRNMVGDVTGQSVLDVGCGNGLYGKELLDNGAVQYTGLEPSQRMYDEAVAHLQDIDNATVHHVHAQDWTYPADTFDLVVSRLALHYIDDLSQMFTAFHTTLKSTGKLVFSVEHPVITSHNRSLEETGGKRLDWLVDNYFITGKREVNWLGGTVIKYHRTVADFFIMLQNAGFIIASLRESNPERENFPDDDDALFQRRQRIPLFLCICAEKVSNDQ